MAKGKKSLATAEVSKTNNGKQMKSNGHSTTPSAQPGKKQAPAALNGNGASHSNGMSNQKVMNGGTAAGDTAKSSSHQAPRRQKPSTILSLLLRLLRTILFDVPLTILFASLAVTICLHHIHDNYLSVQLQNMEWTNGRKRREITYYDRRCDVSDMSTRNVADLLIPNNYTKEECVHHMMVHGASMYPDVLTADTAIKLRKFVLKRNSELTDKDAISVISNEQRWSFGIGANEDPIIPVALREIATNPLLAPALEGIAGNDPAVIEMTAITSAYGAKDQFWHIDTVASMGNDLKHARSFVPSYSLFIPLQDTTADMGATETCPGTQVCHEGTVEDFCARYGFQVSGKQGTGVWKRGYGVLQNQHTYHRGPAHKAKHGEHRVLFILTFAPRPNDRAESRMIGQGGSYSIRWDMWGHTLSDLADATWRMARPWAALKSLGIFKLPGANWGWDYPAVVSMRIINQDVGFSEDDFDEFMDQGGLAWLPKFISEKASEDGWAEYFVDCIDESKAFLMKVNQVVILSYLAIATILSILQLVLARGKSRRPKVFVLGAAKRLVITHGTIALVAYLSLQHIESTPWAMDIKFGRQFTSPFKDGAEFHANDSYPSRPTLPQSIDALFGIRYDGENYGSINRFLDYHPGNQRYASLIEHFAGTARSYSQAPSVLQDKAIKTILKEMKLEGRRMLKQNEFGDWLEASTAESQDLTERYLLKADNSFLRVLDTKIALMVAKARYGELRLTTMAQKFTVEHLFSLRKQLFAQIRGKVRSSEHVVVPGSKHQHSRKPYFGIHEAAIVGKQQIRTSSSITDNTKSASLLHGTSMLSCICDTRRCDTDGSKDVEFLPDVGEVVEAKYEGEYNEWYKAKITKVNPLQYGYDVKYEDGDTDFGLGLHALRQYVTPQVGEVLEARVPGEKDVWKLCAITKVDEGERYDVKFEDGQRANAVPAEGIRRVDWEYEVGDEVIVMTSSGGKLKWSKGVVSVERRDSTYDIRYENGEEGVGVAQGSIHLVWASEEL